jgi:gliding motility-associated-like protein
MKFFILLFLFSLTRLGFSQTVIPTKGKNFWLGFPHAGSFNQTQTKRCDVFITSEVNTMGIISIPLQGWSQGFIVNANQTTTISIPVLIAEHLTSEIIENKGVEITSQDTISVFAISFQNYSADGTVVYPKQALGTEYRICSYPGLVHTGPQKLYSEFLIVATEDGTQVTITTSASTLGGQTAGIPFNVSLDAGESYQVMAANATLDLSGSVVKATDSSGTCRTFAVFSASTCVNIPSGCTACDILFEQSVAVPNWGKTYYAVPFSFATKYTTRIMADQNNTSYTINGGPPTVLNAGQFIETNNIYSTQCINSNKPICVAQYMQGVSCAAAGDPSMMFLNANEQKIDKITFSTITSTVITQHNVNVIMNSSHIGQLTLDGVPVPASSFNTIASCSTISYAQLPLTQGSHTLEADSGFTAYVYGTGSAESYAYSVGSFSKSPPLNVDTILCSADSIIIGNSVVLNGAWWSTATNPNDTFAIGQLLTLTSPIIPDIYIKHGFELLSGCMSSYSFEVLIPVPPQVSVSASATVACQNQQVQLNATTTPSSSIYNYTWTPVTGLNNPNIPNPVVTVTTSGWYHVAVSSPNGCAPTVHDSIYLSVLSIPLPNANGGANQSICPGSSAVLSASGGLSYVWTPGGDTTSTITVSPGLTTDYIVYVTDSNNCGNSDTVRVIVYPQLIVNNGLNKSVCIGESTTLLSSGGVSYLWNPGGSIGSSVSVAPVTNSVYFVSAIDANGCLDIDTFTVTVNALPVANAGPDQVLCSTVPVTLSATGGVSYHWSPGNGTTSSIQVLPATTTIYVVKVTDSSGCEAYDTVRVSVFPLVSGTVNSQFICLGDTVTLIDSGGVSYLWSHTGSTSNSITVSPDTSTNYVVHIVNGIGCIIRDTFYVNVHPLPPANAGLDVNICYGSNATLTASGGTSYKWISNWSTNPVIVVSPLVSQNYIVQVTDQNGCKTYDSVYVNVRSLPIASAGPDVFICQGSSAVLSASGGSSYLWNPGGSVSSSTIVSPVVSTNYIVEVSNAYGCLNTDTVFVELLPQPIADFGVSNPVCEDNLLIFINYSSVSSGSITFNNWRFGDGDSAVTSDAMHIYSNPGNYTVELISTSNNGCKDSSAYILTVNGNPVVDFASQNVCALQPVYFNDLSIPGTGVINKWYWEFGDGETGSSQNPVHGYLHAGTYDITLTVSSDSSCSTTRKKAQSVSVFPLPVADFYFNPVTITIIDPLVEFLDASVGGVSWHWDFDDDNGFSNEQNPAYTYTDTGVFNVRQIVMNTYSCLDTTYRRVYVEPFFSIYFPNAFTPNGDTKNEFFAPYGEGIYDLELTIFDRWGNEIYYSSGNSVSWDGIHKTNGNSCSEGVYVYTAMVTDYKGIRHEFKGSVTLIR